MPDRDFSVIDHIRKYCEEIIKELNSINSDKTRYLQSTVYKNSLALCVLQIGELVNILSEDFKGKHPDIDWRAIKAMRNIVAHKYGEFDFDILWETVTESIPELHDFCVKIESEQTSLLDKQPSFGEKGFSLVNALKDKGGEAGGSVGDRSRERDDPTL